MIFKFWNSLYLLTHKMQSWLKLNRKPQINASNNEKCQGRAFSNHPSEVKCVFLMVIIGSEVFPSFWKLLSLISSCYWCAVDSCLKMKPGSGELRKEERDFQKASGLFKRQTWCCSAQHSAACLNRVLHFRRQSCFRPRRNPVEGCSSRSLDLDGLAEIQF